MREQIEDALDAAGEFWTEQRNKVRAAAYEDAARIADEVVELYRQGKLNLSDWTAHEVASRLRARAKEVAGE